MRIDIFNTNRRYDILYSDPPWPQMKGNIRKSRPNQQKELDYKTCSIPQIKSIHEQGISICSKNHNIFMWTIDKYLHEAEHMAYELGYDLHARFIWDKENGVAPAFTVRFAHEYLLWFYRKGNMLKPCEAARGRYTTVIREKSTKHSQKPIFVYEMIEQMFPEANKLELFARNRRNGWDCWGNECK
jgi:N6-adenosine-specific RNA methylase IME4